MPLRAEIAVGAVVVVLVALIDLRGAIGFSSFGVLLYYFVANVAAFRQRGRRAALPRWRCRSSARWEYLSSSL